MKHIVKSILIGSLLAALLILSGCGAEQTPYEINDQQGYRVSVKFDANGGTFTTNTSVIVDSFDPSTLTAGEDGLVHIPLIAPDDAARGHDAFTPVYSGYFLAGWYQERIAEEDANGNTVYSYRNKWDFANDRISVDPKGDYSAANPEMTLYAAWVPMFQVELVDLDSGETVGWVTYDPSLQQEIKMPGWDKETGCMEMHKFPERSGYTFQEAYLDAEGKERVRTQTLNHKGTVDYETGTAQNPVMKLYTKWQAGEWYHIYNVEQFTENASVTGNYVLYNDLDFTDENWPTALMYGNFSGSIVGNGCTIENITLEQTNNSKVNAGLFGHIMEDASLQNVTFRNVNFTISAGTRVAGASFGLLAGNIADTAQLADVKIESSTLSVNSRCYFGADDYVIGLVCGSGNTHGVDFSQIACTATGESPERVKLAVDGNQVSVSFVEE